MSPHDGIELRTPGVHEARRAADVFMRTPPVRGTGDAAGFLLHANLRNQTVAFRGPEIVGSCLFVPSTGRCAFVFVPHLVQWEPALATRLLREAARRASAGGARLIQSVTDPGPDGAAAEVLRQAGFEELAVLTYMRRRVGPGEADGQDRPGLEWRRWSRLRRRLFAETIERTYEGSLDCPGLRDLRPIDTVLDTHRHTGTFRPKAWHVAFEGGEPVGVELVNEVQGRGDLVYLGVVPEARGRGLGRALAVRAIRDATALRLPQMGLAADTRNFPALRLYEGLGFQEVRRRRVWFVPEARLAALAGEKA